MKVERLISVVSRMMGVVGLVCGAATMEARSEAMATNQVVFTMPRDGWATIAINDAAGMRVRNLFGDLPTEADPARAWGKLVLEAPADASGK